MGGSPRSTVGTSPILIAALLLAVCIAFSFYLALDTPVRSDAVGTISLTFLLLLPAALSALVSYLTDRQGERHLRHHLTIPFLLIAVILLAGLILLQEGVICLVLLAPLWLTAAIAGSLLTFGIRRRIQERGRLFCTVLLLFPLIGIQVEASFPPQPGRYTVLREVIIDAPPEQVWPMLIAIPDIAPEEGRWNAAQDLFGIPRPLSASLERRGATVVRKAVWQSEVRFEEHISGYHPTRSLEWTFAFPDESVQEHTDRHIAPRGAHLRIDQGAYHLERIEENQTRLRLETRYALRTPLNSYAALWGELLLGGIQENVLAIVKNRAERQLRHASR